MMFSRQSTYREHPAWAPLVGILVGCLLLASPVELRSQGTNPWSHGWVVEPSEATVLIRNEEVTLLDARPDAAYEQGHVTGAIHVDWEVFTPDETQDRGELLKQPAVEDALEKLGINFDEPILVVGQPLDGWGEAGRLVWMLRSLGHPRVALVDGGHAALVASGLSMSFERPDTEMGTIDLEPTDQWTASRDDVKAAMEDEDVVLLDTRHRSEYEGATPYGERRGGHVPGAVHLHFRDLLDDDGRLLPAEEVRMLLQMHGIDSSTRVIAYCTGGVRSAWLTVVLTELGYSVKNYAGSMWDWSFEPAESYPLERVE